MFPSSPIHWVARYLNMVEADTSTCCFSRGDAREGPRSLLLLLSGCMGGSLWRAHVPKPGCCPGAAGCSHSAAYPGAILGHPFFAPALYPGDKDWRKHKMPYVSHCVGPCGAVNQLSSCHLALVCLLQGPEVMAYVVWLMSTLHLTDRPACCGPVGSGVAWLSSPGVSAEPGPMV